MDLMQSQDAESPGPSSEIIGQKPPKRDHCKTCLLGISSFWHGQKDVQLMDILASGENCRACAGIVKLLNPQMSLPMGLTFAFGPLGPRPMMTPYLQVGSSDESRTYEFFTTSEGSKDILPALAGVARRYGERHGKTYLAGLWKEDLPGALMWKKWGNDVLLPRPLQHVAPTWSWASLPPSPFHNMEPGPSSTVRFLGSSIQPHDSDVYAGARHLEITLEGPVLDLKIYKQNLDSDLVGSISENINGIVLLKNHNTESGVAKFERIGSFTDHEFVHTSYVDESNEFAEYCGGNLPPNLGARMGGRATWLMERAETRQVTLI
ncbi:hypothetical protein J7T55_001393 [Diaporthe amygdali]|uniref:uncharacterized protein n=1 Tax=Phomopsis amygdali TaxID=1214568 RepID=UPI0022FED30D|nr:uncharacterized protein J7T55_001393 [Diaporthe amygdali]KAJ0114986.1 hypothetical protein J7T55_001393 [Diaporthe amygdali]